MASEHHAESEAPRTDAQHAPRAGDASASPSTGGQAMDLIATMEVQLQSIKQARAEHDRVSAELLAREHAAAERAQEISRLESELVRRDRELAERDAALAEAAAAAESERAELESLHQQLVERESRAAARESELAQIEARLADERAALSDRAAQNEQAAAELIARESALSGESERLAQLQEELTARAASQQQQIAAKESEMAEASRALETAIAHTSDRAAELARERERFEHERSKAAALAAEREKTIAAMRAELEKAHRALKDEKATSAERSGKSDSRAQHAEARQTELTQQLAALESQLAERDQEIKRLAALAQSASSGAGEATKALRQQIESKESTIASLEADQSRLASEIAAANKRVAELEERLAAASDADSAEAIAELEQEIAKRDLAIETLRERLKTASEETELLLEQAAQAENTGRFAAPEGMDPVWAQRRRERLQRYKRLLREQSRKILQARTALAKRHEQYEQLLQKRAELAEAKMALEKVSGGIQRAAGRNKASVAVLCIAVAICLLGALSWAVAQRVVTPEYLVQATLAPQPEGGEATIEQLESWQRFVEQLSRDPRLMEVAADRMKRRGMAGLDTPSALSELLSRDLDLTSTHVGHLTATLRGVGAERTRRILDTYLASMVAVANDGRDRRHDGATTAVVAPPTPRPEPIENPHILYAAAIWAGSSTILLFTGLVIWRRLAKATRLFDAADPSVSGLDESRWPTVTPPRRRLTLLFPEAPASPSVSSPGGTGVPPVSRRSRELPITCA